MLRCLANELGADVNQAWPDGATPLHVAAEKGILAVVRVLVRELGAAINKARLNGMTPLLTASSMKHADVVTWLVKAGADHAALATLPDGVGVNASNISRIVGASAEQTAYLEAKMHCSHPGCSGAGVMKCTGCRQARYCGEVCQLAHWKAHKADCRRWSAELKAGTKNVSK